VLGRPSERPGERAVIGQGRGQRAGTLACVLLHATLAWMPQTGASDRGSSEATGAEPQGRKVATSTLAQDSREKSRKRWIDGTKDTPQVEVLVQATKQQYTTCRTGKESGHLRGTFGAHVEPPTVDLIVRECQKRQVGTPTRRVQIKNLLFSRRSGTACLKQGRSRCKIPAASGRAKGARLAGALPCGLPVCKVRQADARGAAHVNLPATVTPMDDGSMSDETGKPKKKAQSDPIVGRLHVTEHMRSRA